MCGIDSTPSGLWNFMTPSQGSSPARRSAAKAGARNPGLNDLIPSGLNEIARVCLENPNGILII